MEFSINDIKDAIFEDDAPRVIEIFEECGLHNDGTTLIFTSEDMLLIKDMLSLASAKEHLDGLDGEIANELIKRTAMTVEIFDFIRLVTASIMTTKLGNFNTMIPETILETIRKNEYKAEIGEEIQALSPLKFKFLLCFLLSDEIKELRIEYNPPIIQYIFENEIIPSTMMFNYMAICQREPIDEHLRDLGSLVILDALLRKEINKEET